MNSVLDPVGTVVNVPAIQAQLEQFIQQWQAEHPSTGGIRIKFRGIVDIYPEIFQFLLNAVDVFIVLIEKEMPQLAGADKKATVLNAAGFLYDALIANSLPIWLRPFNGQIKALLIDVVLSAIIDFIVSKYNVGSWVVTPTT